MLPRRSQVLAMVVAGALGGGVAVACGVADVGDREDVNESNENRDVPEATPGTTIENPTQLTPTGDTQPEVTQPPSDLTPGEEGESGTGGTEAEPEGG